MRIQSIENKSVLLVGGCGFIGHNLALHLKSLGARVSVLDSLGVNNVISFSSYSAETKNQKLYLKILTERQRLLREAKIPLYVQDARNYHAMCSISCNLLEKQLKCHK